MAIQKKRYCCKLQNLFSNVSTNHGFSIKSKYIPEVVLNALLDINDAIDGVNIK